MVRTFALGYTFFASATNCATVAFCTTIIGFFAVPSLRISIAVDISVNVFPDPTSCASNNGCVVPFMTALFWCVYKFTNCDAPPKRSGRNMSSISFGTMLLNLSLYVRVTCAASSSSCCSLFLIHSLKSSFISSMRCTQVCVASLSYSVSFVLSPLMTFFTCTVRLFSAAATRSVAYIVSLNISEYTPAARFFSLNTPPLTVRFHAPST